MKIFVFLLALMFHFNSSASINWPVIEADKAFRDTMVVRGKNEFVLSHKPDHVIFPSQIISRQDLRKCVDNRIMRLALEDDIQRYHKDEKDLLKAIEFYADDITDRRDRALIVSKTLTEDLKAKEKKITPLVDVLKNQRPTENAPQSEIEAHNARVREYNILHKAYKNILARQHAAAKHANEMIEEAKSENIKAKYQEAMDNLAERRIKLKNEVSPLVEFYNASCPPRYYKASDFNEIKASYKQNSN